MARCLSSCAQYPKMHLHAHQAMQARDMAGCSLARVNDCCTGHGLRRQKSCDITPPGLLCMERYMMRVSSQTLAGRDLLPACNCL